MLISITLEVDNFLIAAGFCNNDLTQRIENKIREQKEITTTEERWTALSDIIVEEAEITIEYQKGQAPRKPWITGEMIQEMEKRRK